MPLDHTQPAEDYEKELESMSKKDMIEYKRTNAESPFFILMAMRLDEENLKKIHALFKHAKRLGLNPNQRSKVFGWDNTPLMFGLAYERIYNVPFFFSYAKEYGFEIDLSARDEGGKTALLFAILLGNTPSELIDLLTTPENYDIPNNEGLTPIMAACALRRSDIVRVLLYQGLQLPKDPKTWTQDDRSKLRTYLSQQHPTSGKSLMHFAVMRAGVVKDQKKDLSNQDTVLNILKLAEIDGFRAENADGNSMPLVKPYIDLLPLKDLNCTKSYVCYFGTKDYCGIADLNSYENVEIYANWFKEYKDILSRISKTPLIEAIMAKTADFIQVLQELGCDLTLTQKNGNRTAAEYIKFLIASEETGNKELVSIYDKKYLFPLAVKLAPTISGYINRFFYNRDIVDLVMEFAAPTP